MLKDVHNIELVFLSVMARHKDFKLMWCKWHSRYDLSYSLLSHWHLCFRIIHRGILTILMPKVLQYQFKWSVFYLCRSLIYRLHDRDNTFRHITSLHIANYTCYPLDSARHGSGNKWLIEILFWITSVYATRTWYIHTWLISQFDSCTQGKHCW